VKAVLLVLPQALAPVALLLAAAVTRYSCKPEQVPKGSELTIAPVVGLTPYAWWRWN
jgi:hypothetical protein